MFFAKNKIDKNLRYYVSNNCYKKYRVLIKYKNLKDSIIKRITSSKNSLIYVLEYSSIIVAKIDGRTLERLLEYPEIEYITLDEYLFLCGMSISTANSVHYNEKFNLSGKGVEIAIVDSGVFPHPDLTSPVSKIKVFKDLINNCSYPYDDNGHGTSIAGIIAGNGYSSNTLYKGVATGVELHCYKAFDKLGKGYASTILYALEDIINSSLKNNIKILALPFEQLTHNTFITNLFNITFSKAINHGIIPIVPSGSNENMQGSIMGIATLQNCLTIGGINTIKGLNPYLYSSSGPFGKYMKPDLSAACCNITSLNSDSEYISEKDGFKLYPKKLEASYKTFSGTSLAVAYVAGLCSLLYEKNPSLSFSDISSLLKLSCEEKEFSKFQQGEGIISTSKLFS